MNSTEKARLVREHAEQTIGSQDYTRHPLCRFFYSTDGVQYVARTCGAFWLVDAIASHVATNKALQAEPFHVWTLKVHAVCGRVMLVCTNGNDDNPLASQEIPSTDFPSELLPFRFFCERGHVEGRSAFVLMLPEER